MSSTTEAPAAKKSDMTTTTLVHVTALDGIVNVNALFTVAVFIGLQTTFSNSIDSPKGTSLAQKCISTTEDLRNLLVFEVISFSFFLFSSLIAQGLKLHINILNSKDVYDAGMADVKSILLQLGMVGSAVGSGMGCLFLMLAMVIVVEVKLGKLSCRGHSMHAIIPLIALVSFSLVVYIYTVIHAFTFTQKKKREISASLSRNNDLVQKNVKDLAT